MEVYYTVYLVFISFMESEGKLNWTIENKISDYGQNLTLICHVSSCCSKEAGWEAWDPKLRTIFIDIRDLTVPATSKYAGNVYNFGYSLLIRNVSMEDINIMYTCVYGDGRSDKKMLMEKDIFFSDKKSSSGYKTNTSTLKASVKTISSSYKTTGSTLIVENQQSNINQNEININSSAGIVLGPIVAGTFLVIVLLAAIYWIRKRGEKKKLSKKNNEEGTEPNNKGNNTNLEESEKLMDTSNEDDKRANLSQQFDKPMKPHDSEKVPELRETTHQPKQSDYLSTFASHVAHADKNWIKSFILFGGRNPHQEDERSQEETIEPNSSELVPECKEPSHQHRKSGSFSSLEDEKSQVLQQLEGPMEPNSSEKVHECQEPSHQDRLTVSLSTLDDDRSQVLQLETPMEPNSSEQVQEPSHQDKLTCSLSHLENINDQDTNPADIGREHTTSKKNMNDQDTNPADTGREHTTSKNDFSRSQGDLSEEIPV